MTFEIFLVMCELVKPLSKNVYDWQIDCFFGWGIYSSGIWRHDTGYLVPHILRPLRCLEIAATKHPVMQRNIPEEQMPNLQCCEKPGNSAFRLYVYAAAWVM